MYDVYATDFFMEQLDKLGEQVRRRVDAEVERLKVNPQVGEKLKGILRDLWRVKIDTDYRLVYQIHSSQNRLQLVYIGHRKKVYKKLERMRRKGFV